MMKFGEAFAAARKAGQKEFEWNGKKYHTRTKEEDEAKAKEKPKAKPADTLTEAKVTAKRKPTSPKISGDSVGDRYARAARSGNIPGRSAPKTEAKPEPKAKPKAEPKPKTTVAERYKASAKAGTLPGKRGSASRNVPKKAERKRPTRRTRSR